IGAFHGHAHNHKFQLDWHPMHTKGAGNMEGEGCEHVFSMLNEIAQGTCHALCFHQHQAVDQHFTFWDEDKYAVLSKKFYHSFGIY
ncbi:hypothetical protein PAXRUDRAFT_153581, partial [Paxillus rubicundulus Ve08.2h10]